MRRSPVLVHSPFALAIVRFARARGVALESLFGPLPEPVGHIAGLELPTSEVRRLANGVARALQRPELGLDLAGAAQTGQLGVLEFSARASPTVEDALGRLERYSALVNPHGRFSLERTRAGLRAVHRIPGDPLALGRHGNGFTLATLLRFVRSLGGEELAPTQVWFAHPEEPGERASSRELFATEAIHWGGGENALRFDSATLARRIPSADPPLALLLEDYARRLLPAAPAATTTVERVADRCRRMMLDGAVPTLATIARALHASPRTLQRALAKEERSFEDVLDAEREAFARTHLADGALSIAEVTYLLGYSEPRAFARAFRRWTGVSPSAFRKRAPASSSASPKG